MSARVVRTNLKYGMTFEEIAEELDAPYQSVQKSFNKAMKKIISHPQGHVFLESAIHLAQARNQSQIGCGSVECRHDWIELQEG